MSIKKRQAAIRRASNKYAPIARERTAFSNRLAANVAIPLRNEVVEKELARLRQHPPKVTTLSYIDPASKDFIARLKTSSDRKEKVSARLKAISFLNVHFPSLANINDSILSGLQSLILSERKDAVAATKVTTQNKKRK